ncbi:rna recognition motif (rrm) domain containing protein, putative [Schistosoma mansoni]|uniref:Rna recognition motif (Rrm) domain containing protein, putative n=1 Tax=Schistosoma mansoni TaxID=6183 RepID=G4LWW5_SCHMA|nr:rna recognition motif (rrm) domain containing protein, putative [Schistosoma mansoni]|eukprot:XP_018645754.1 rna recognition motif (rrm) domain containing protein, putative [Schistosoma mansoni]
MSTFSGESQDDQSSTRHRSPIKRRSRSRSPNVSRVRSKRIVIANIPYDLNWQKLKELFREQIGFTGFLQLFKKNGKPNGMGLMEFKTLEGAQKAIETMHRFEVGDRKLVVRQETARDAARLASMEVDGGLLSDSTNPNESVNMAATGPVFTPQMLGQVGIDGPVTDSVYVSNLDYSVTWQKLKDVFKSAGKILSAVIKTDSEGNSRGVGILKFSNAYEAVQAVNMFNNQILKDRPMRVKIDRQGTPAPVNILYPPSQRTGSSGILGSTSSMIPSNPILNDQQQSSNIIAALVTLLGLKTNADSNPQSGIIDVLRNLASNANPSGGLNTLGTTGSSNNSSNFTSQSLSSIPDASPGSGINRSYSGQLPQDGLQQLISAAVAGGMSQTQITSVLSTLGLFQNSHSDHQSGQLNASNIIGRDGGGGCGDRSVDRSHFDNGYVGRSKYEISGNYRVDSRSSRQDSYNMGGSLMKPSGSPNLSGRGSYSRSSDRGRDENGPQHNNDRRQIPEKVVVKNLPFSFDSHDVKRIFREVGDLNTCNLVTDAQGHSQGIAFLTYADIDGIYRAIDAFDGKMFEGRRLRVHAE